MSVPESTMSRAIIWSHGDDPLVLSAMDAFRAYAQKKYLESDLARNWPEGMLDRINAL